MENAIQVAFQIAVLVFSVVIHEVSHGYAALAMGDKTAQYAGRLTLNPMKHLDPVGSLLLPALLAAFGGPIFGWARPVPYNPYNLRNQKWGPAIVGAAGPLSNIALAVFFGLIIRSLSDIASAGGSAAAFAASFAEIAELIVLLNLSLAVFNMVPIPPLDGSKVLFAFLPYQWYYLQEFLEQHGFLLLLVFIFFFARLLFPIVLFLFRLIAGGPPLL